MPNLSRTVEKLVTVFLSLLSIFLSPRKSWRVKKKVLIEFMMSTEVGEKAKNRLKLASQSFDLSAENLHSLRGWLMDDIIFCTQSTLTLVPKVWNFVTFDYCIFPS